MFLWCFLNTGLTPILYKSDVASVPSSGSDLWTLCHILGIDVFLEFLENWHNSEVCVCFLVVLICNVSGTRGISECRTCHYFCVIYPHFQPYWHCTWKLTLCFLGKDEIRHSCLESLSMTFSWISCFWVLDLLATCLTFSCWLVLSGTVFTKGTEDLTSQNELTKSGSSNCRETCETRSRMCTPS